jgi:hypothetical protein
MADISVEKKPAGDFTWLWAAAAILAVVGLMAWLLSTRQAAVQVVTDERSPTEEVDPTTAAETVAISALAAAPAQYADREVRVEGATVAAVLGERGLWVDVPGGNPFLTILGPEIPGEPFIMTDQRVNLEGTVQPVTEADLDRWVQQNIIRQAARDEASFAEHYLLATRFQAE